MCLGCALGGFSGSLLLSVEAWHWYRAGWGFSWERGAGGHLSSLASINVEGK
jgi:hypothetical protein